MAVVLFGSEVKTLSNEEDHDCYADKLSFATSENLKIMNVSFKVVWK